MNIAIIPARGGSKRIPKKNIKYFEGKPIIAYSIEAAIHASCFDKIIVSTDDSEIAKVAKEWGADAPFVRPANISTDHSIIVEVIRHAIDWCEKKSWNILNICCIYPTAPFLLSSDIISGLKLLNEPNTQYSFSATSYAFPIQRAFYMNKSDQVEMFYPEHLNTRSQDLKDAYHDAGQFYWGKVEAFKEELPLFANHSRPILLPRTRVQDIDTLEDWDNAEKKYRALSY